MANDSSIQDAVAGGKTRKSDITGSSRALMVMLGIIAAPSLMASFFAAADQQDLRTQASDRLAPEVAKGNRITFAEKFEEDAQNCPPEAPYNVGYTVQDKNGAPLKGGRFCLKPRP